MDSAAVLEELGSVRTPTDYCWWTGYWAWPMSLAHLKVMRGMNLGRGTMPLLRGERRRYAGWELAGMFSRAG